MSIQLSIKASGLNIVANLKDEALPALIALVQENRDENVQQAPTSSPASLESLTGGSFAGTASAGYSNEQGIKDFLKAHGAAELLNRLKWDSFSEKILLLGAWYEARGGSTPWRSSDMDETFKQAKEKPPGNFPRDIRNTIKSGWVHAETPRTYSVTRSGWNKIGHAMESLAQQ
jgi:hypothetical protein